MSTHPLVREGLTNYDTEDLGVIAMAEQTERIDTFCTSEKCCAYMSKRPSGYKVKKFYSRVPRRPARGNVCPTCGSALINWKGKRPGF